ncbi:hypothetical protein LguiB_013059 [Lonicera macranthoides]
MSPQSSKSPFQFLFPVKRKRQEDSTRSLVLLSVLDLHSLKALDLSHCNLFDGAFPSDLESICSLGMLILNGNYFSNIPSLTQLSQLSFLDLDDCKMLDALPELPSSIEHLSANDCPSLRLFADQFTNSKNMCYISFKNCLQLLKEVANGERRDIPEWFCKQTTGTSISLKLPSNWDDDDYNFVGCGICVAFKPTYKAFPIRRKNVAGVCVEISVRTCTNREYRQEIDLGKDGNISKEQVCLVYKPFYYLHRYSDRNNWCEIEFSIKYSSPNAAVVTKWGVGLVPKSRGVYIEPCDEDG